MVPDVPVSEFSLTVRGGKRGLLVNTHDLCRHKLFSRIELGGQNGAQVVQKRARLKTGCKKKKHHHRRHHHRRQAD